MNWLSELIRRVAMLWRQRQFDEDLREEMKLHLDLRREERIGDGLSAVDAAAAAQRKFGNITMLREQSRGDWGWTWLEQTFQDFRYAVRSMIRNPGFTFAAVTILALGAGANSAIFSVVNAVLLRPLEYKDADRLVTLLHNGTAPVGPANYLDWRAQTRSFEDMGAAEFWTPNLTGVDSPEKIYALRLTQSVLPMLGVEPMLGRVFAPGEDQPGSENEIVLSHKIWQRRFAGDRGILGKSVLLNGTPYTVIGVMPPTFQFAPFWATRAELWAPLVLADRATARGGNSLRIFARLKPGVELERARADVASVTANLERQFPGSNRNVVVTPLKENVVGKVETPLLVVMGAVGFVLLIACANVAHMLLARAAARQKEIAVRSALGAGGMRLIRQFITEGLLLAGCGAVAGLLLASVAIRALVALGPGSIPRLNTVTIDPGVVLFSILITVLTGVAFSLAPAMHAKTLQLAAALKENTKAAGGSVRHRQTRNLLAASEIALAFILLIGAGLLLRSFSALRSIDPGFNPDHVLSMVVSLAGSPQGEPGQPREMFYRQIVDEVGKLPGVEASGAINHLPLAGDLWGWNFYIEGQVKPRPGEAPQGVYRIVMPGYFRAMRLPVVKGREISLSDDTRSPGVVLINEAAEKKFWPDKSALGQRISFDGDNSTAKSWLTIIGVVKDARQIDWAAKPQPEVYLAALQNEGFLNGRTGGYITLVARTAGDPSAMFPAIKNAVWAHNRNLTISEEFIMTKVVETATSQPRFEVVLLSFFAGIALLISTAGIYALMSFSVSRRTHEIGIRIALGASRTDVALSILRQGILLAAVGSLAGAAGALLLSRLMSKMLFGVQPADPVTFVLVAAILNIAAMFATYLPARRAAAVDPIVALRQD